jgi:sugar phosphate isomerase/epimerase
VRLGVAGMMPGDLRDIDAVLARKIVELGFTGVAIHMAGDPESVSAATCERARQILDEQGVEIVQFWGFYPSLLSLDEAIRQESVRILHGLIRLAALLGASMVCVRPTSLNPRGVWWPHPDNYAPATEDRLVRSLQEIATACEVHGIPIALECHVTTTLDSPQSVARIIQRTGSNWIKVNLDPVNFIRDLRSAYHTTGIIQQLFDTLSPYIVAAHVKDVYVEDRHVIHISETIPGDGNFDFDTFFRKFEALLPDGYALIEHLPESQVPQAMAFVTQKLNDLQIPIVR